MFFFNLSLPEFLTLFTAASGLVVTLYLLSRSRRKQTVATLRFWKNPDRPTPARHHRRIQQPLSLLLQLLGIALLLLAMAQLRLGRPDTSARDHVLLLETSAWMGANAGNTTLLDQAKRSAQAYVNALPSTDRVMLVRADGLATPATQFETNRAVLQNAITESRPGASALNLDQAIGFARQVRNLHTTRAGEIVFAGAGRVTEHDEGIHVSLPQFRVLQVTTPVENCGLRKIGLRRSAADPAVWEVFVSARNYGSAPRTVPLVLQFGGAPVGTRRVTLVPGRDEESTFQFRTRAAGWLEAHLLTNDALPDDNRALLELPAEPPLKVAVFTEEADMLRPALAASPQVQATYASPSAYSPKADAKIFVFDRFRPKELPNAGIIWIEPPAADSPAAVRTTQSGVPVVRWKSDHAVTSGLRTKQLKLETTQVFAAAKGDIPVAEAEAGPVILARPGTHRSVFLGFHPGRSSMRFDLATPLLFANMLRWIEPDVFRRWEMVAGSVGSLTVAFDSEAEAAQARVVDENSRQLPHTTHGKSIRFFSAMPGSVRVLSENREQVYSLTLPEIGEANWQPPASAAKGMPGRFEQILARDIWHWLAIAGGLLLLIEWMLYGRGSQLFAPMRRVAARIPLRKAS